MTSPDFDWLALADRENARTECVGHIRPAGDPDALAELQRGNVRALQRRLLAMNIGATLPERPIVFGTNTDTE